MAVFTSVSHDEAQRWFSQYDLGPLEALEGIASGIENSNFFVTLGGRRYVLTLFERLSHEQLPFYLGLMKHLARHGVHCPDPIEDRQGQLLGQLNGKPAALVTCLPGRANMSPGLGHCEAVGRLLAEMHLAAADYPGQLPNLRGLPWWQQTVPKVLPFLNPEQTRMISDELLHQQQFALSPLYQGLPRSAVHADLFRDNVLFDEQPGQPPEAGAIDFYFAGVDTWVFDLAVTCNDWCIHEHNGQWDLNRLAALLRGYRQRRMPTADEQAAWPTMLRAAALRFWVSRLFDLFLPRPAEMVTPKDPTHFERVLRARREAERIDL